MSNDRYGKTFSNKTISRTPQWIDTQIHNAKHKVTRFLTKEKHHLTQCPICGSAKARDFTQIYGFVYKECQECFDVFLQNPLKDLAQLYTNDGEESSFECYLTDEIFTKRLESIARPKVEFIHTLAKDKISNKIWLDIGSGGGENLLAAKELGYEILGFESDTKALNFSNQKLGGEYVKSGFLNINDCEKSLLDSIHQADIITFFNTLEHLENPKQVFTFFGNVMKQDSLLVIEVPRHPSLASYANAMSPHRVYRHLIPPYHLNIFSEQALEIMYKGGGYSSIGKWCYGQGFMDIIHAFENFHTLDLYEKLCVAQNEIQVAIDKSGLADFILLVLQKD